VIEMMGTPIRVLLLITHLEPGGAQETVLLLADGLRRRGLDVTVGAHPSGSLQPRLQETGVPVVPIPHLVRPVSPGSDIRAYREIAAMIRDRGFHVVHTHSSKAGVLGRLAARRARVRAIVHTSHGLPVNPDMSTGERALLLSAERTGARASDRIVAVSEATAHELVALRLARPAQIAIIPSGIDLDRFRNVPRRDEARRSLGLPTEGPVVGWVGRFFPQKRPDLVLRIAERVLETLPEASFLMVGDGPGVADAVDSARGSRIHVVGYRQDIETAYAAMDVFLLASAWEGLPRTVLEAGAAGVPVVATDVSGISEVVRDGETGRLAAADDWPALAESVIELLRDEEERATAGKAIREVVGTRYSAARTVEATAGLYGEILGAGSAR
jgi:glycosyltransferase involved in cell wall biosynthesis